MSSATNSAFPFRHHLAFLYLSLNLSLGQSGILLIFRMKCDAILTIPTPSWDEDMLLCLRESFALGIFFFFFFEHFFHGLGLSASVGLVSGGAGVDSLCS